MWKDLEVCILISVCVHNLLAQAQTSPYVSFQGQTLANHSYVDLSRVGDPSGSDSVQCVTDLSTCCSGPEGPHRGDWYFPNGTRLPLSGDISEHRGVRRVELRHTNSITDGGIYRCDIPTNAVHHDSDISVQEMVYVGLYHSGGEQCMQFPIPVYPFCYIGNITIAEIIANFTVMDRCTLQLTLTCISTGGPSTNVTWTRDFTYVSGGLTETVLNDPVTAHYTHTLNVTEKLGGNYTCTVANNKPSNDSLTLEIKGKNY